MSGCCGLCIFGRFGCAALIVAGLIASAPRAGADDSSESFFESNHDLIAPAPSGIDAPRGGPVTMGALTWYDDQAAFEAATGDLLCIQDFEESTLPPASIKQFVDVMQSDVPCEPEGDCPFPNGLEGCDDMTYQSNDLGGEPDEPSPSTGFVLDALSAGFAGATSDLVMMDRFPHSVDVIIDGDYVHGFGGTPVTFAGGDVIEIRVYDDQNNFLGMNTVPVDPGGSHFFGVISDGAPIGRVNGFDPLSPGNEGAEGIDNIQIHLAPTGCIREPAWVCDGDVDGDGQVNPVDSGVVQSAFGSTDEQDLCNYDMDCDGQINPVDAGIVQALFGTCEAPRGVCP